MKKIFKYKLIPGINELKLPKQAEFLSVGAQQDNLVIWALINELNINEFRYIEVLMTGEEVPVDMGVQREFIGTTQVGWLVFHVFERI